MLIGWLVGFIFKVNRMEKCSSLSAPLAKVFMANFTYISTFKLCAWWQLSFDTISDLKLIIRLIFLGKTVLIGPSRANSLNSYIKYNWYNFMGIKCKLDKEDTNSDYHFTLSVNKENKSEKVWQKKLQSIAS